METVRPSAVSGLFYPANPDTLKQVINDNLEQAVIKPDLIPKALIVPHAGYMYSGPVAASAYKYLQLLHDRIKHVVLIGPSHRVPFFGMALSSADYFATPLGDIAINKGAYEKISNLDGVVTLDEAHAQEHCLEVQLPFLQQVLSDFDITPIVAGDASPELVANVIETLWGDEDTLIVISSDLSHYLDYDSAKQIDQVTSDAIVNLDVATIDSHHACGSVGVRGLLTYARRHHVSATVLDLRNSGDTAGKRDSVVGYGAYLFA